MKGPPRGPCPTPLGEEGEKECLQLPSSGGGRAALAGGQKGRCEGRGRHALRQPPRTPQQGSSQPQSLCDSTTPHETLQITMPSWESKAAAAASVAAAATSEDGRRLRCCWS